jgi:hypothetical protein
LNRAQRRAAEKEARRSGNHELEEKISLFSKLPKMCLTCFAPFDNKNREQVMSWHVVERTKEGHVHLYCPSCWDRAIELAEDFVKRIIEKQNKEE